MRFALRLAQIAHLSRRERADLVEAVWRLALANRRLAWGAPVEVARTRPGASPAPQFATRAQEDMVARVSWAIPRAAVVVPWRADCLRQAEAARGWLARHGLEGELKLGARRNAQGRLETHAWLMWRGGVVTGGDIEPFSPFAQPRPQERQDAPLAR